MQIVIQQLWLGGCSSRSGSCWFQTWCIRTICYGVAETSITWVARVIDNVGPADTRCRNHDAGSAASDVLGGTQYPL